MVCATKTKGFCNQKQMVCASKTDGFCNQKLWFLQLKLMVFAIKTDGNWRPGREVFTTKESVFTTTEGRFGYQNDGFCKYKWWFLQPKLMVFATQTDGLTKTDDFCN